MAKLAPSKIIIHHSATRDCDLLSWHAIEQYHREQGWSDIGYHAGIEKVRGDYVCLFGRPDVLPGAHTRGQNSRSLGFVFVGNYDTVEPDKRMLVLAARRVLAPWCLRYDLDPTVIHAHRDYAAKTCPGKRFDMALLRNLVWNECHALRDG
jgi:N-acetylmuramoyl-L-alanine amidase